MTEPTWHVYQLRSDTELLYVGYTRWLKRRFGEHRRGKPWWPEVTRTHAEPFATEDEARQREKELWAAERPKYNKRNPFQTHEERAEIARERTKLWMRANRERYLTYQQKYRAENRDELLAAQRKRNSRGPRRQQQSGPGLF